MDDNYVEINQNHQTHDFTRYVCIHSAEALGLFYSRYVVVLTKADKSANSVSKAVLESVVAALRDAGVSRTPVVLTSASSRLGRDGMWR